MMARCFLYMGRKKMDWAFMGKYAPMYVEAAGLTLRIGCAGVLRRMQPPSEKTGS